MKRKQKLNRLSVLTRNELLHFLDITLHSSSFSSGDYCPNGLQIEGKNEIKKISFAVSAAKEVIEKAIDLESDALIVHHGLFWKSQGGMPQPLIGPFAKRIFPLIKNNINLMAYHLPLDAHPKYGNAAMIGKGLSLKNCSNFAQWGIKGSLKKPLSPLDLEKKLEDLLQHKILLSSPDLKSKIKTLGIVTGGASKYWRDCLNTSPSVDAFFTGEMSEPDYFESKESGVHMFAGGHHASEQFGVKALLDLIEEKFGIEGHFISTDNPC